jgi:hypothetical protein
VGLRTTSEKPAIVLWLVYALGWVPALAAAFELHPRAGPVPVLSGAGASGAFAGLALAASLAILSAAYIVAIRRPPSRGALLAAAAGSFVAALAMPLLFSADVYAYAYYGDVALAGGNPYTHGPAPRDPLAAAAVAAWDGHVPPRCVYGPVAVAIAALADLAGSPGGTGAQIFVARLAAGAAYAAYVAFVLRLVRDPRSRAAFILNPVVIWSVAEGHNDAAMLALLLAGLAATRERWLLFAFAALVKIPALAAWGRLRRRDQLAAACLVAVGYLPLAAAVLRALAAGEAAGPGTPWQSPLGMLAAVAGRIPAVIVTVAALAGAALAVRRLPTMERAPAFALAAWFALPNAYPWYALWIVPLASRSLSSMWSRALLAATLFAPARAIADAVFRASDRANGVDSLHPAMIALEFLPPLLFLALSALRRRSAAALAVVVLLVAWHAPAGARVNAPSPQPAAPPATPGTAAPATTAPGPTPAAGTLSSPTPAPGASNATPVPVRLAPPPTPPQPAQTSTPGGPLSPAPAASGSPPAFASPPASESPPAAGSPPAFGSPPAIGPPASATPATPSPTVPTPTPTLNPFGYIITPPPVPVSSPDGPHILEVALNDRRIRAGGPLLVRVITSANVVGVEARALGRFIPIPQSSPGLFNLEYMMPGGIPFWWLNRSYDIVIAAATADGRQTSVSFPMLLTR